MRAIAVLAVAVVLAGCGGKSHDQKYDSRLDALGDPKYGKSVDAPIEAPSPGSSASDYKIDPDVLAKNYAEIKRRADTSEQTASTTSGSSPDDGRPSKWGPGWERFGDWYVKALHDEMDTVTDVRLFTAFNYTPSPGIKPWQDDFNLGFEIFGGSVVALSPSSGFLGDGYWPHCDYDLSSVSVDGAKAVRLTPVDMPGSCNKVDRNGEAIQQLKQGKKARIRLGYMDGTISLSGFSAAWARAIQLSK